MQSLLFLAFHIGGCLGVHEQGHDQPIKTQDFSENEDEDHADEETGLLSCAADTGVADNANSETVVLDQRCSSPSTLDEGRVESYYLPRSKTGQTDTKTRAQLDETCEEGEFLLQVVRDQDRDHQAVDTDDTSHNDRDNICTTR